MLKLKNYQEIETSTERAVIYDSNQWLLTARSEEVSIFWLIFEFEHKP